MEDRTDYVPTREDVRELREQMIAEVDRLRQERKEN